MLWSPAPLVLAALASAAYSEVHTVGPAGSGSDFTSIQAAIDAAVAGDTVRVDAGEYAPFVLDKPLLVQGTGPDATTIKTPDTIFAAVTAAIILDIPAGEIATVAGMKLIGAVTWFGGASVDVLACEGSVFLHDLETQDVIGIPIVQAADVGRLILSSSTLAQTSPGPAAVHCLHASVSRVWVIDTVMQTATSIAPAGWSILPQDAARVLDGEIHLAGSALYGPDISPGYLSNGREALGLQGSVAFAKRTELYGGQGTPGAVGGYGARLTANSFLATDGSTLVKGGLDGAGVVEQLPVLVEAGSVLLEDPRAHPSLSAEPPRAVAGDLIHLTMYGQPGTTAQLLASVKPDAGLSLPGVLGDVFIDPSEPLMLGFFTLDSAGEALVSLPVPPVLEPTTAVFQWVDDSGLVETSNPAFVSLR